MSLLALALRSLRLRMLSSVLTGTSIAVAVALLAAILLLLDQSRASFQSSIAGYRVIVGPKDGSSLELTLNTVFHFGNSKGLIRFGVYRDIKAGRVGFNTQAIYALPQARGDTYSDYAYPIIGTTDEMFTRFQYREKVKGLDFAEGGPWAFTHDDLMAFAEARAEVENRNRSAEDGGDPFPVPPEWKQVVVGAEVAARLGLELGDEIVPVHGRAGEPGAHPHPEDACVLVGVLAATGTAVDQALWVPLGAQLSIGGHSPYRVPYDQRVTADDIMLSAVVVKPVHRLGPLYFDRAFESREDAQVADPGDDIPRLLALVGDATAVLQLVALLVLLVGGIGISVSIYNSMNERRREMAIYRCLGARRWHIGSIVVLEAVVLAGAGAVVGLLLCHVAAAAAVDLVQGRIGVRVEPWQVLPEELYLLSGTIVLGAVAGLLPAAKGVATEVARHLAPTS